ncbi:MAG: hydantoinase/oxoprolinase family protein [Gammaproteobacteria bacterium]
MERGSLMLLGIDTGGTFTDFVLFGAGGVRVHKVLSTPQAPERAILRGIRELGVDLSRLRLVHGSTVATNAVLEGRGVRTALITNRGLGDLLAIGRQARAELYNLQPPPAAVPVPEDLRLETGGRLGADGSLVDPLTDADLAALATALQRLAPEAVAINLLFSFLDPQYEQAIEAAVPPGVFVSRSSDVLPEYREYERGVATWLNAWVGPLVQGYLGRLADAVAPARAAVMQSSGGTMDAAEAGRQAVHMLLSGPAGGLMGARFVAGAVGVERVLTFDMGGTSTDVALIDGEVRLTSEGRVGGFPVAVPMVDMHTIGAGGGSLAYVDAGGLLQVGPRSAGADPGPACYGRGGSGATVTDANLVLGRLRADAFLGGAMVLDVEAARTAVAAVAQRLGVSVPDAALGIVNLANEHMARALRVISVQRGVDPRGFALMCFGGAGGLHVCALAEALGMARAIVPVHGGVLSALGMLVAPRARHLSRTVGAPLAGFPLADLERHLEELERRGRGQLVAEGAAPHELHCRRHLDLRYLGQSYPLQVEWEGAPGRAEEAFHALHQRRYGHRLDDPVELLNVRVSVAGSMPPLQLAPLAAGGPGAGRAVPMAGFSAPVPAYARDKLAAGQEIQGPALITETVATAYLAPEWRCTVHDTGTLVLQHGG